MKCNQFSPWTYEIRVLSKTYPCLLLSGFRRNWSRYSKKAYDISIFPELNFSCLNIMCEKCSYCKEDLMREKIFFDEIWSTIRIVEEVSCSPLHPFEFTHILLLIFIALALEHSNFYSRHFIEDRKSLESSYVFFFWNGSALRFLMFLPCILDVCKTVSKTRRRGCETLDRAQ